MSAAPKSTWCPDVLYLLHFERKIAHAQHYLGCCREDRLETRLTEHARGHGAKLVAHAVRTENPIYLARVFPELGFESEKAVKRNSHFKNLCPVCCPLLEPLKDTVKLIDPARPLQPPQRAIWDWRPRPASLPK